MEPVTYAPTLQTFQVKCGIDNNYRSRIETYLDNFPDKLYNQQPSFTGMKITKTFEEVIGQTTKVSVTYTCIYEDIKKAQDCLKKYLSSYQGQGFTVGKIELKPPE